MAKRFSRNAIHVKNIKDVDLSTTVAGDTYLTEDGYVYLFDGKEMLKLYKHAFTSKDEDNFSDIDKDQLDIGDMVIVNGKTYYVFDGNKLIPSTNNIKESITLGGEGLAPDQFKQGTIWLNKNGDTVTLTFDIDTTKGVSSYDVPLPDLFQPVTNGEIKIYTAWRTTGSKGTSGEGTKYASLSNGNLTLSNLTGGYNHTATITYVAKSFK